MKQFILNFIVFLLALQSKAAVYYVKVRGGTGNGLSDSTAWSYSHFLTRKLDAGDKVCFKRGEAFFGSFAITGSGSPNRPITYTAYGSGARPIISGLITAAGWARTNGGVFWSAATGAAASLNNVIIDGLPRELGRFPNADAPNGGWLNFESYGRATITDNDLTETPDWTGAELLLRTRISVLDRLAITSHSGKQIIYDTTAASYAPFEAGYGYFFQKHIKTLDKFGEWYHDARGSRLHIYFGNQPPSNHAVQFSGVTNLITSTNKSYITFDNLTVQGANENAFEINGGTNIRITNCDIRLNGGDAIRAKDHPYLAVENCSLDYNTNNAIWLGYGGCTNVVIRNNTINHTGLLTGQGRNGDGNQFAIWGMGNSNLVESNKILNTGYTAVFLAGNNAIAQKNFINNFCSVKDDGGGLYAYTSNPKIKFSGIKFLNNVVLNGISAPHGTSAGSRTAMGLYLDGFANHVEAKGNTIAYCAGSGFFANTISNCTITDNTFYGCDEQMRITRWNLEGTVHDNSFAHNKFISKRSDQIVASFNSMADDINTFGFFTNNYYARPLDDNLTIRKALVNANGVDLRKSMLDLDGWKAYSSLDAGSNRSKITLKEYTVTGTKGPNKFENGTFSSGLGRFWTYSYKKNIKVSWATGVLDGGSAAISYRNTSPDGINLSMIYQEIGVISKGTTYKVNFSLKGSGNNVSAAVYFRNPNAPYNLFSNVRHVKISNRRTENEVILTSRVSKDAQLVFEVYDQNVSYWVDNVSVLEANVTFTNPDTYLRFEYNGTGAARTLNLGTNRYKDITGKNYSGTIILQPYTSLVLIRT